MWILGAYWGRNCSTVKQTAVETRVVTEANKEGGAGDASIEATINFITGNNDVTNISIPKINDYHESLVVVKPTKSIKDKSRN